MFAQLRGTDSVARVEAAKKLAGTPGLFPRLSKLLRDEVREEIRHAIVYALSWQDDLRTWPVLLRLLSDPNESAMVRAQAAEGLAYHFHRKRRGGAGFRSALSELIKATRDPSPEVRYFAAFALGASGALEAVPVLRKLVRDRASPSSFVGSVGDEARDAIEQIQTRVGRSSRA